MENILILLEEKENKKLLEDFLAGRFKIKKLKGNKIPKNGYDLIIADTLGICKFKKEIQNIKKSLSPEFIPLLLLSSKKDLKISKKMLWEVVNDLIITPVEKIELEVRIRNLLMARELSLKLREHTFLNLRAILYSIGDGVIVTDKDGKIKMMNKVAESLTGWKEKEARGKDIERIFKIVNEFTKKKVENPIKRVLKEGIVLGLANHTILISKDGKEIPILDSGAPVIDSNGDIIGAVFVFKDLTKERVFQREIEKAKRFSEGILETMREPLVVLNATLEVVYANKAFYNIFKTNKEKIIGKKIYKLMDGDWDILELKELLEEILPKNTHFENFKVEKEFIGIGKKTFLLNARRLLQEKEKTDLILLAMEDITEKQKAEENLRESEEKYRLIFENSADVIYTLDTDFKFVDVSPSITYNLGYAPEELKGKRLSELNLIDPAYLDILIKETERVYNGEKIYGLVFPVISKDGKRKWAEISAVPLYKDKKIIGEVAIGRDITRRVEAELQAKESEERYFKLIENLDVGILISNEKGDILYYNKVIPKILNYSKKEFEKIKNAEELYFIPEERKQILKIVKEEGYVSNYELWAKTKDERPIQVLLNVFPIKYRNEFCLQSLVYDLSEIRRKEIEIQKLKETYETFFMNDLTADFIATFEGKILTCNPAFLKIFGFSTKEEALNFNITNLYYKPEEREQICSMLKSSKKIENLEIKMKKIDGTPLDMIANYLGIFDENGNIKEVVGYLLDDTKRKQLEAHLRQAQTLESLGTLAGGVAHDFNNILNIILGHTELLQKSYNPQTCLQNHKNYIKAILDSSYRGISLVKQLLTFSRKTEAEIFPVNINQIIKEIEKLAFETFPRYVKINLNLKEDLPVILGDGNQLHQAILNLLINSRDALLKGGEISIKTDVIAGEMLVDNFPDVTFDDYILIEVSDNGIGMDENTLKNIFVPFYTTKEKGKGTGLGLSVVYAIVKNHNGFIDVKSSLGLGTTFNIYLPCRKDILIEYEEKKDFGEIPMGEGKTILVIEDEEMLLNLLKNELTANGYNVLLASDGLQGIEVYKNNSKIISCVITDFGLPGLSGDEVIRKIKEINPHLKSILVSGLLDYEQREEFMKIGINEIIQKPYSLNELLYKLGQLLK